MRLLYLLFAWLGECGTSSPARCLLSRALAMTVLAGGWLTPSVEPAIAATSTPPGTCQPPAEEIERKASLRQAAYNGNANAKQRYFEWVEKHRSQLQSCRDRTWPDDQAIWIRLYPCDVRPGAVEELMDWMVNRGYNQVYVEVFYDGQVLLPAADNPTPWESVVRTPGYENVDLLARAIQAGRERGLKVYAWMFTLNFGYSYGQLGDRSDVLARNGEGDTTLTTVDTKDLNYDTVANSFAHQAFVDPYSEKGRRDYSWLVDAVKQRNPDGVLFDYVRYPRRPGTESVVTHVSDLWIYGDAAQQALYRRALNQKGLDLIRRFLQKGYITVRDIEAANKRYPDEGEPMWQGRNSNPSKSITDAAAAQPLVQQELWYLAVAHAVQGILDFLQAASQPVRDAGISTGAVFFPKGNQSVGAGFDSRLQPWDRFPGSIEWHPMVYGVCGHTGCILEEVQRTLNYAPDGTSVIPALAGAWGQSIDNRPPLEIQMRDIRQVAPEIDAVSHFAYSWQEPDDDRDRKFCTLE